MLQLIAQTLEHHHISYLQLTGKTRNREKVVNLFQSGFAPILLISLKAGGVGLNLTRADTVIHYDPWWNPASEDQASDRSHRIGQNNPVFIYKLIVAHTVEEAILNMQEQKRTLLKRLMSKESTLTENDMLHFFQQSV